MTEPLPYGLLSAAGNRILILDASQGEQKRLDFAALAPRLDPGWSFDQLMLLARGQDGWQVQIYNRDGSPAEQCGNGMRCLAAWLDRQGLLDGGSTKAHTPAGAVQLEKRDDRGFFVALPPPSFDRQAVRYAGPFVHDPMLCLDRGVIAIAELGPVVRRALAGETDIAFDLVSMGNPHAVIWIGETDNAHREESLRGDEAPSDDTLLARYPLAAVAQAIEARSLFERGVNLSVALRPKPQTERIHARVHERGAGETQACGSAACAIAASARIHGWIGSRSEILFPGGRLEVIWKGPGDPIWLGGRVDWILEGELR